MNSSLSAPQQRKKQNLFLILGSFFLANALVAEFIGVKIFSLEGSLGIAPFSISLFGFNNLSFNMTCGVVLWPVVFIMTDIINEYFGKKGVRFFSYIAAGLISYSFVMIFISMKLTPAGFWVMQPAPDGSMVNMDIAFNSVFGQGLLIIIGSIVAFLVGQLVDVLAFHQIKKRTGQGKIWLRSTGSTLLSQLVDSFVVLFIAFYLPGKWSLDQFLAIATVNYIYKFFVAVVLTPVLYLVHFAIDGYLGKDLAAKMMHEAAYSA